jgi:hypothetical protein
MTVVGGKVITSVDRCATVLPGDKRVGGAAIAHRSATAHPTAQVITSTPISSWPGSSRPPMNTERSNIVASCLDGRLYGAWPVGPVFLGGRDNGPAMTVVGGKVITSVDRCATVLPGDGGVEGRGNCPSVRNCPSDRAGDNFNPNFVMAGLVPATQERGTTQYSRKLFGRTLIRRMACWAGVPGWPGQRPGHDGGGG